MEYEQKEEIISADRLKKVISYKGEGVKYGGYYSNPMLNRKLAFKVGWQMLKHHEGKSILVKHSD